ncbi:MAG TPA: SLBB domain-containing protein [Chitinophagaceae bacterium]|nr:SLBB domain-containing protein [Chitinophagaceae bacterium]
MKKVILFVCLLLASSTVFTQANLQGADLRQVHVDQISDDDIIYYYNRMQQSGVSFDQAAQVLQARGMPEDEINKLRARIQTLKESQRLNGTKQDQSATNNGIADSAGTLNGRSTFKTKIPTQEEEIDKRIFGSELFNTASLTFEPNLRIATPINYVIGPDDQLVINVYGLSEQNYTLTVNPEGNIIIPNVGPVFVGGLTIEQATAKIKAKLASTIYKAINTGATNVQVNLGNIKSIRVNIIGQAKRPGSYTLSSLSTVFNALFLCGGPGRLGSYRNIELVRNNKVYKTIDLYKVLVNGNTEDNVRLMDQDIIHIPFYKTRVILSGQVKRPGIFETVPQDNLSQVLNYAGGFTDSAYRSSVKITQITDKEKQIEDVESKDFDAYKPHGSDSIDVGKIINRFTNRVSIEGAVMRPGVFELTPGLTLKQLIQKADGLKEDAFLNRGLITRLQDNLMVEVVAFNVAAIIDGTEADIPLKREDKITISSIFDLKTKRTVEIRGEVRFPGVYDYKDSTSLKDLVFEAGGFTDAATGKRIEVARRVTNGDVNSASTEIAQITQVDAEKDLEYTNNNFYLKPFDVIIVHNNPGYFTQKTIKVEGEVMYPGEYVISANDEKLSSIVNRAGGFKNTADPSGASLRRINKIDSQTVIKSQNVSKLATTRRDTAISDSLTKEAVKPYDLIGIDLQEVMSHPGITNDLILEDGDIIFVPKKNQAVKVRGEVLFPTQFAFQEGLNMKDYIDKAGGFTSNAQKRKSFVLGANGNARRVRHFFFFKSYPEVLAGDDIFVPKKPEKPRLSTAEAIGITSAAVGVMSVVLALINNLK